MALHSGKTWTKQFTMIFTTDVPTCHVVDAPRYRGNAVFSIVWWNPANETNLPKISSGLKQRIQLQPWVGKVRSFCWTVLNVLMLLNGLTFFSLELNTVTVFSLFTTNSSENSKLLNVLTLTTQVLGRHWRKSKFCQRLWKTFSTEHLNCQAEYMYKVFQRLQPSRAVLTHRQGRHLPRAPDF